MSVYCPQTATTYATPQEFVAATKALTGQQIVAELSGLTNGQFSTADSSADYPDGLLIKAALGEEFTGVEGVGARLHNSTDFPPIKLYGTTPKVVENIQVKNATGYAGILLDCSYHYKNNITFRNLGVFNRAGDHPARVGINFGSGLNNSLPQAVTIENCIIVAKGNAIKAQQYSISTARTNASFSVSNVSAVSSYSTNSPLFIDDKETTVTNSFFAGTATPDISCPNGLYKSLSGIATGDATTFGTNAQPNIDYNLVYEDYANGDFRQKATSPLLGAGELGADIGAFAPVGGGPSVQSIGVTEIISGEAFGTPTLQPGQTTVQPVEIASAESFGIATLAPGQVTVLPTEITSAEAFGIATLTSGVTVLYPVAIPSAEAFDVATIIAGATTISPTEIPSAEAFGTPLLSSGGLIVAPISIDSGEAFDVPIIQAGTVLVSPTSILSGEAFGSATVYAGSTTLQPVSIASGEAFGTPTLSSATTLQPTSIDSAEAFGIPQLVNMQQFIQIDTIQNGEVFGRPILVGSGIVIIGQRQILNDILAPILHDILKEVH